MKREDLFNTVCMGDRDAARFLLTIVGVLHTWDDLIDLDHDVTPAEINAAFFAALVELPRNRFYAENFGILNPVLLSAINNWHVANLLESTDSEADKRIAFISRSSYIDLITTVAFLIGGDEWVREVGPEIRRFAHSEGWEGYLANLKAEQAARSARAGGK